LAFQYFRVDPTDLLVDAFRSTAGCVVFLRQVFSQHTLAESRLMPGNIIALLPGLWWKRTPG
jgi:hypothetical protein